MNLLQAKKEINRYVKIGVDKSDVALLIASWGLENSDLEKANWYLHEISVNNLPPVLKIKGGISI